ncbi:MULTISPECIES: hypothetical protein [Sorangium]|uniref:Uncharacterized protein n=1 Tax=Sorangium cellulosum TaxID=56 RepID=A0A4P2QSE3_SORCE|nr:MULTISPECIES: hypothetical protein [Sorangium]AUX33147.1 uncharacterized protein SOCE836_053010 [Sorangium cellulosum]AUX33204.1 uncharacterized protein SOCE836_053580 [Sorangium cellulosum]WCQ92523.1 hypothetical protein NQZ70_05264 [Sorangium sp. Soce836]
MSTAYPRPSTPEPITYSHAADDGTPISGADVVVRVRRADGLWLDWADGTYAARAAVAQLDEPMPEIDEPGTYEATWPGGEDGERYKAFVAVDGVVRGVVELHVGGLAAPGDEMSLEAGAVTAVQVGLATAAALADVASDAEIARKVLDNRQEVDAVGGGRCITYDDDGTTPWRTRTLRDGDGNGIALGAGVPARRGAPQ